jgi:O-antigen/teichoic acid export membrane protein
MFADLNLRQIQATDSQGEFQFADYLGLRLITVSLAFFVVTAISFIINFSNEIRLVIISIAFAKSIESLSDVLFGLMQQCERMDKIAISYILKGILSLIALGLSILCSQSLVVGILSYSICWNIILFFYDIPNALFMLNKPIENKVLIKNHKFQNLVLLLPNFTFSVLGRLAWLALPLGIVIMLTSLQVNIPRYFIGYFLGERELGVFVAISYPLFAGYLLVQALGITISPRLAQYYFQRNIREYATILFKLIFILLFIGALGILLIRLFGREFLSFIYNPEYAAYTNVFLLLMVAESCRYIATFLRSGLIAIRHLRIQVPIYALSVIISILICYTFIPRIGITGAAWANIYGNLVEVVSCGLVIGCFFYFSSRIS